MINCLCFLGPEKCSKHQRQDMRGVQRMDWIRATCSAGRIFHLCKETRCRHLRKNSSLRSGIWNVLSKLRRRHSKDVEGLASGIRKAEVSRKENHTIQRASAHKQPAALPFARRRVGSVFGLPTWYRLLLAFQRGWAGQPYYPWT